MLSATLLSNDLVVAATYVPAASYKPLLLSHQCKHPIVRSYVPLSPLPCFLPVRGNLWQFRAYDLDKKKKIKNGGNMIERKIWLMDL